MNPSTSTSSDTKPSRTGAPRAGRRWWVLGLVVVLAAVGAGELIARYHLGLGDPPLSVADPDIEYLFAPNQKVRRFGNKISYNQYSMRATPNISPTKADPSELRILVLGDSVINGGVLSDDSSIATTLLQQRLQSKLNRPVIVMNASAGSWGPPNLLGYVRRFGFVDADLVVLVFNSGDYADVPSGQSVVGTAAFPDRKPLLALQEGVMRYLPRYLGRAAVSDPTAAPDEPDPADIEQSLTALGELLNLARKNDRIVLTVLHQDRQEIQTQPQAGHHALRQTAESQDVPVLDLGPAFRNAVQSGLQPYRDKIHPNDQGQRLMADELFPVLRDLLTAGVSES